MNDLHVHTKFSCDSEAEMRDYLDSAIARDVETVCFTDHVDLNPADYGYNYYDPEAYFAEFHKSATSYKDKLRVLSGIEFGEPHLYPDKLDELAKRPYDFIIGSIHWIGDMFPCKKVREQYTAKEFYSLYWNEVLSTVKQGGFDSLGHIDFPKRYYGEIYYKDAMMNEIFKRLLDRDMVIEINTSSLRKGHGQTMPGLELLNIYKANGGRFVTLGSDAHEVNDLAADHEAAESLLRETGLQEVIYVGRNRIPLPQCAKTLNGSAPIPPLSSGTSRTPPL